MGITGSPNIFQTMMPKVMVALEFVRTYSDGLLFLFIIKPSLIYWCGNGGSNKIRKVIT